MRYSGNVPNRLAVGWAAVIVTTLLGGRLSAWATDPPRATPPRAATTPQISATSDPLENALPSRADIARDVEAYFQTLKPPIAATDIISRKEVDPLLARPEFLWLKPRIPRIQQRVLPESDYLVQQLRTPAGRAFAQRVAGTQGALDRVDRLRAGGTQTTTRIIQSRQGHEWILYLAAAPSGQRESKWIEQSGIPFSQDFAKPTGRIYTKPMLIEALGQMRDDLAQPDAAPDRRGMPTPTAPAK